MTRPDRLHPRACPCLVCRRPAEHPPRAPGWARGLALTVAAAILVWGVVAMFAYRIGG